MRFQKIISTKKIVKRGLNSRDTGVYILHFNPPPPLSPRGGGKIWPKALWGKENEHFSTQFVKKLEQNDQKFVYFYTLANICKGEKSPTGDTVPLRCIKIRRNPGHFERLKKIYILFQTILGNFLWKILQCWVIYRSTGTLLLRKIHILSTGTFFLV